MRKSYKMLVATPEEKRPLGTPRHLYNNKKKLSEKKAITSENDA
jgi:hypothetical protein